ncbi:hypothetical protein [Paenibacillus sp. 32352]|uniref:hypothetical protein n=1 Tax=Paenibacillus sp. 32352 TaxID=1969111 RepID=UPI00117CF4C1|nr:hypothetical protein [Paenibacillus sp. 32352]
MSSNIDKEAIFEEFFANNPEKFNVNWEVHSKQEWVATNLRCDVIYRDKSDHTLHLVEFKRHYADFPNISQVLEYYSILMNKGVKITKVYIAATGFSKELLLAMDYGNIQPLNMSQLEIREAKDHTDEQIEGIYNEPLVEITSHIGTFPEIKHTVENSELYYQQYQSNFKDTPQTHFFEIWEYKVPGPDGYYLLSIKHAGNAYHFKHKFGFMQGTKRTISDSTRNYAWDFLKDNCLEEPYKNIIIRSYVPTRIPKRRMDHKKRIDSFLKVDVNPDLH